MTPGQGENPGEEVFSSATNAAPPTDSEAQLSYFSRSVLGELYHSRSMLCPCHIAANLELAGEKALYPVLSFLLAADLLRIVIPAEQPTYYLDIEDDHLEDWEVEQKRLEESLSSAAERIRRQAEGIREIESFTERRDQWYRLFLDIGSSEVAPRYYVDLTKAGTKRFREESRAVA